MLRLLLPRRWASAAPAASAAAAAAAAALTPEALGAMDAGQAAAALAARLPQLSASALPALLSAHLSGRRLLAMDAGLLERSGLAPGDAQDVRDLVGLLRHGSPKTVLLHGMLGCQPEEALEASFATPQELLEFLTRQSAAGFRRCDSNGSGSSRVLASRLQQLEDGERYTIVQTSSGSMQADVVRVRDATDTDAKVIIENVKRAVEGASLAVFGEALVADPRNDIRLRGGPRAPVLGDVDCLFTGPTLHLLLERKRRLGEEHGAAASVIAQIKTTRDAYRNLRLHVVQGAPCRVASMVFAEALDAAAQQAFLGEGIYVLCQADMRVHAPPQPLQVA